MKLRTQLLLVFLLLAALPLALIALVSYVSALETFHRGVEAETQELADRVTQSIDDARGRAQDRVQALGREPQQVRGTLARALTDPSTSIDELTRLLESELGEVGGWVESLRLEMQDAPMEARRELPMADSVPAPELPPGPPEGRGDAGPVQLEGRIIRLRPPPPRDGDASSPQVERLFPRPPSFALESDGLLVGQVEAVIDPKRMLREVMGSLDRSQGEIPFAFSGDTGLLLTPREEDWETLAALGLGGTAPLTSRDWVVAQRFDAPTGLTFGVARPVRESLRALRRNALRNLLFGLGLAGVAFLAVLPVSSRMDRNLSALIRGAERIAGGDLDARVPVQGENEIGQLSRAFNRMAFELQRQQRKLLDQQQRSREAEVQRRLLEVENLRRGQELEEARRFQLALLPRELPQVEGLDLAVVTRTATEVGGDYYDFRTGTDGALTVVIGDATGHGARAGLLVAVVKSLVSTLDRDSSLTAFLSRVGSTIRSMGLRRMAMALTLARLDGPNLGLAVAGMPPPLVLRAADGAVEELVMSGLPLGTALAAAAEYRRRDERLEPGDVLLLTTDGFPELLSAEGDVLGYDRLRQRLQQAGAEGADANTIARRLEAALDEWVGERPLEDDTTFLVLRRCP